MITQRVELGKDSYDICIGDMEGFGAQIRDICRSQGVIAVIADRSAWENHGGAFSASLEAAGLKAEVLTLPPGEKSKSLEGLMDLYHFFDQIWLRRDGLVVAFGGGVVGDLAGFAAATWMRGVPYIQVPTTLLAQVDSSVGGKTAVDLPEGKNLMGSFYQPKLVLIDTGTLNTLPPREMRCGMAEVVKYGAVLSYSLFIRLQSPPARAALPDIVAECCRLKADVVARDEKDTGERMLLNYGHTFGHAIEKLGGYESYTHGEAVAVGMVLAAEAGEALGLTQTGSAGALRQVLTAHGLSCDSPYRPSELIATARTDKKADAEGLRLVLLKEIGSGFVHQPHDQALKNILERMDETWESRA